jgi:hypothetical protein
LALWGIRAWRRLTRHVNRIRCLHQQIATGHVDPFALPFHVDLDVRRVRHWLIGTQRFESLPNLYRDWSGTGSNRRGRLTGLRHDKLPRWIKRG